MLRFVLTRLGLVIPTFVGMTLLAFFLIRLVPGDPIETLAGERGIDPARHAALVKAYGLDQPVLVQYGIYLGRLMHGDLGKSMITQASVVDEFTRRVGLSEFVAYVQDYGAPIGFRIASAQPARSILRETILYKPSL